ncbi:hypothetical protein SASPL_103155 [Salvia splendens]|uniref:Pentatricopeptide repeat-containing protein n=1 Tax=Salvia splendens TaxID=180675 RepID=A0A8X8YSK4_SALSN|nr:hypothetical protein SASPL_103155 [Salvia splendens]
MLQRRPPCFVESETRRDGYPDAQEVRLILSSSDYCSSLDIGIALKFFVWIGKQPNYSRNEQSYNVAMKIAGLTDLALSCFREMKLGTCKPTKSMYFSIIASLCGKKGRKVDEAIQIYEEMMQAGLVPGKELVEAYVGCLCEVNRLSDARRCIESLHKFGFSIPLSYSLYVRALCRAGKLDDALALVDEAGCEKHLLQQYTYGSLVHGLLRQGRAEEALEKINGMKQLGFHPTVHVHTSLIVHFFKDRDLNRVLVTLEEMKEHGCQPTVVTYSALLCGYVRLGKVSEACDVFHRLKREGTSPDFKTYSMFIDCLCGTGKSEDAFTLIPEMLRDGIVPSTVNFRTIISTPVNMFNTSARGQRLNEVEEHNERCSGASTSEDRPLSASSA